MKLKLKLASARSFLGISFPISTPIHGHPDIEELGRQERFHDLLAPPLKPPHLLGKAAAASVVRARDPHLDSSAPGTPRDRAIPLHFPHGPGAGSMYEVVHVGDPKAQERDEFSVSLLRPREEALVEDGQVRPFREGPLLRVPPRKDKPQPFPGRYHAEVLDDVVPNLRRRDAFFPREMSHGDGYTDGVAKSHDELGVRRRRQGRRRRRRR